MSNAFYGPDFWQQILVIFGRIFFVKNFEAFLIVFFNQITIFGLNKPNANFFLDFVKVQYFVSNIYFEAREATKTR